MSACFGLPLPVPTRMQACCWVMALAMTETCVDHDAFDARALATFESDVANRRPHVDENQLRPVGPQHRLHLLEHRPGSFLPSRDSDRSPTC